MNLILGSVALKHWFPDLPRQPKDLDCISPFTKSTKECEAHWVNSFSYILENNQDSAYVDPDFLYTIKISHAAWDAHWDKTMHDIHFMKKKGCKLDKALYNLLFKEWIRIHGPKNITVTGSPEEFFNGNVSRQYNHDDLHHLVKFYDEPLHNRIRRDPNDVRTSKYLWDKLNHQDKLKCVLEEAYVFALERYFQYPPKIAIYKALKHLVTKSTKGYFNLFMIDNFEELIYYDKNNYLKAKELL